MTYAVARRAGSGFAESDQRKNRESHLSQRNGLMKIMARITRSMIPLRFERWIRLLRHSGQLNMAILLMWRLQCQTIFR